MRNIKTDIEGPKKEHFLRTKMWISFLVSLTTRDRGTIPNNIGNNILITNNMYITKNFLSSVIMLVELSIETPVTLLAETIMDELRKENSTAVVDFIIRNKGKNIDLNDAGLKSRIRLWEKSEDNPYLREADKKRAVRLLYTIDQVKEGQTLYDSRIFLTVRDKTGTELSAAESIIYKYLAKVGCIFRPINSNLSDYIDYISLISHKSNKRQKHYPAIVNSIKTLSQLLPNTHSVGDDKGIYCGINMINNTPFKIDFSTITMARNIYVITGSGGGKTALVLNMCASALENGMNVCVMDIKGNEFNSVVDAVGGATISLRETSDEYINTFKMIKEETTQDKCELYFKDRVSFSKFQMMTLSGVIDEEKSMQLEGFLDEFLNYMYTSIGVRADNINTWSNTLNLNPYVVYDIMSKYLNAAIKEKYRSIIPNITTNLRMYFSRDGSKSYIFSREFQYKNLLNRRAIRFDFGILAGSLYDATIFKLKFAYMSYINGEYVTGNFNKDIMTFKVLEESQAVSEDVIEAYSREYTLRRAQKQITMLLGNSVDALVRNPKAMPIIETTTALFIGKLNKSTADLVIKYFDIENKEGIIRYMSQSNKFLRHFLFINNMVDRAVTPIIKVQFDPNVKYKILTPKAIERI